MCSGPGHLYLFEGSLTVYSVKIGCAGVCVPVFVSCWNDLDLLEFCRFLERLK